MKKFIISMSTAILLSFGVSSAASANTYQVKNGDTLWSISKKHNVTVNQIKSWNKLSSDRIVPKQILHVSAQKTAAKTAAAQAKPAAKVQGVTFTKELTVTATAYTADCKGCTGITATGLNLKKNPNAKAISVDPKVIPLGTKVYVEGYGYAVAADKGSAVKGNKIDVFFSSKQKALQWGVKKIKIKIVK
ncbi:3D domain-containing protein [Priestia abyssalis]|uniref:3D domain-containing protein n=1 Tax=Priestia abyssalis TaxID=1221450 RepID=UPI0009952E3A|nr:3D domain-containing protein [Priestia abyssalis]